MKSKKRIEIRENPVSTSNGHDFQVRIYDEVSGDFYIVASDLSMTQVRELEKALFATKQFVAGQGCFYS